MQGPGSLLETSSVTGCSSENKNHEKGKGEGFLVLFFYSYKTVLDIKAKNSQKKENWVWSKSTVGGACALHVAIKYYQDFFL